MQDPVMKTEEEDDLHDRQLNIIIQRNVSDLFHKKTYSNVDDVE